MEQSGEIIFEVLPAVMRDSKFNTFLIAEIPNLEDNWLDLQDMSHFL